MEPGSILAESMSSNSVVVSVDITTFLRFHASPRAPSTSVSKVVEVGARGV